MTKHLPFPQLSVICALLSVFILSACTIKDQLKTKILDKVQTKITEEKAEIDDNQTDEQLLNDLNTDDSTLDADLKTLDTELQ